MKNIQSKLSLFWAYQTLDDMSTAGMEEMVLICVIISFCTKFQCQQAKASFRYPIILSLAKKNIVFGLLFTAT